MRKTKGFIFIASLILLLSHQIFASEINQEEYFQAEKAFESNDFTKAEPLYRSSLLKYQHMKPMAAYLENQIAKCLRYQKKTGAAVEQYRRVQKEYSDHVLANQAQEEIARTYYEARDYEKAGPEFEKLANELEKAEKQQASGVTAASAGKVKSTGDLTGKKNDAFGYAAYSYYKSEKKHELISIKRKIEDVHQK